MSCTRLHERRRAVDVFGHDVDSVEVPNTDRSDQQTGMS